MPKKARKWSNLRDKLPHEKEELSERETKVRARIDELSDETMKELAASYASLEEEEALDSKLQKARSIEKEALERRMKHELKTIEENFGVDTFRSPDGTFYPGYRLIPYVTDKVALEKWIKDTGRASMMSLPSGKLSEIVGEAFDVEQAALLTPGQRAALKPGEPGSAQPPPGVGVWIRTVVNRKT